MNRFLFCGALLGLISVALDAYARHGLDLSPQAMNSMDTALRYNMIHAALIVALSLASAKRLVKLANGFFSLGILLFSFSIYANHVFDFTALTPLTPVGGMALMAGWGILVIAAIRHKK